jgi:small subunit ribosomal protein S18
MPMEEQSQPRRQGGPGGRGGRGARRKKRCPLLENKIDYIDYKDTRMLERFLGDNKKILPRRLTGVSTTMQRRLAVAVKRAKQIALLPYV